MRGTERSPGLVVLFSLITCGIYLLFWYISVLSEMREAGHSPTGNTPGLDILFMILSCGIYGLYVDYRISKEIAAMQHERGLLVDDTSVVVLILDLCGLGVIGSALQQTNLNRIWQTGAGNVPPPQP